jgi:hypothetical protein
VAELTTPDGKAVEAEKADVEREFAAAMSANGDGTEPAAPPKRKLAEPADKPKPKRGRPSNAERARVTAAQSAALSDEQRADGIRGLMQVGAGLCMVAGKASGQDAFKADAITLVSNADELAAACVATAKQDEKFARVVDKIAAAGPYGALIGAVMGVSMQLVRNHRPAAALPGTMDPAELIRQAEQPEQPEQMAA